MFVRLYWMFSCLGLMTLSASLIRGFRYEPDAPTANVWFNIGLYAVFFLVHIVMTLPAFKSILFGRPQGTLVERRVYITVSIVTWIGVYWLHRPIPGFGWEPPEWVAFLGLCMVLFSIVAFFEFATFEMLANLLGMPGSALSHTVGSETPLVTEGPYAKVRHPMYRAAFFLALSSLVVHPNAGQLLFAVMIAASFIGFIPIEERQLIKARGEEYLAYCSNTPYRVFHGIW